MIAMLSKIGPILSKAIPAAAVLKEIARADPRLQQFIAGATVAGHAAEEILGFVKEMTENPSQKKLKKDLSRRSEAGTARPEELARLGKMEDSGAGKKLLSAGAAIAGGLGAIRAGQQAQQGQPEQEAIEGELLPAEQQEQQPQQIGYNQRQLQEQQPQQPQQEQAAPPKQAKSRSFFEIAMEGQSFFDLPQQSKPSIGKLKKRIDELERQGVPFKDKSVQRIIKGLRKLTKFSDKYEPKQTSRQQQVNTEQVSQQSDMSVQFQGMMDAFLKEFGG